MSAAYTIYTTVRDMNRAKKPRRPDPNWDKKTQIFSEELDKIQRMAIESWKQLAGQPEIIVIGKERNAEIYARDYSLKHIHGVDVTKFGTPYESSMYAIAREHAETPLLAYLGSDIILTNRFTLTVDSVLRWANGRGFALVAGRREMNELAVSPTSPGWEKNLWEQVNKTAWTRCDAIDVRVFPKGLWDKWPRLVAGRAFLNSWFVNTAKEKGVEVIDGTEAIQAVHKTHRRIFQRTHIHRAEKSMNSRLAERLGMTSDVRGSKLEYEINGNWEVVKR